MNIQSTKSQVLELMLKELNDMQKQCTGYQKAVEILSKQVSTLAYQVSQAEQRSAAREKKLMHQLNAFQTSLKTLH